MKDYIERQATVDKVYRLKTRIARRRYVGITDEVIDMIDDLIGDIDDIPSAELVEGDKAQKEIDYWHDKAQSYEQTILKLSLNKADVVEVVRCRDCKYAEVADPEDSQDGYICQFHRGCIWFSGSYCSWGERADT